MKFAPLVMSLLAAAIIYAPSAEAAPSAKRSGSSIQIKEAVDDNAISVIKAEKAKLQKGLVVSLEKIGDADLAKLCDAFPDIKELTINSSKGLTSIAPLAKLTKLTKFEAGSIDMVKDFSPLAGLTELTKINVSSDGMTGDLKWMSGLTKLSSVTIGAKNLTSFEGIPSLPALKSASFYEASPADLTPLVTSLPNLTSLHLNYCTLADLAPLAKLANLNYLSLYGATVADFSPLAQSPKLKKLTYYAVKSENFASLGALKQVSELDGGLTKLADISWVAELPNLKTFDVFAEHVTDYSPLAKTNVENFTIWNMRTPVGDLGVIGQMPMLKKLKLWSVEGATNSAGLAGLANLESFTITTDFNKKGGEAFDLAATAGWNKVRDISIEGADVINADKIGALPELMQVKLSKVNQRSGAAVDVSGFAKAPKLNLLTIYDCTVSGLESFATPKLRRINLRNVKGITSLEGLKACPDLYQIEIQNCDIPDSALQGFSDKVKIKRK
ncbi:MAG: hypothetical protein IJB53_01170 [Mailhella sp.]|nr:hypothetical protein [Mailhella sp.]